MKTVKELAVKTVSDAEKFLRLSQQELHAALDSLKLDYVTTIRKLAEAAKDKRFKALQDAIKKPDPQVQPDSQVQPELREAIVGTWIYRLHEVPGV